MTLVPSCLEIGSGRKGRSSSSSVIHARIPFSIVRIQSLILQSDVRRRYGGTDSPTSEKSDTMSDRGLDTPVEDAISIPFAWNEYGVVVMDYNTNPNVSLSSSTLTV